MSTISLVQYNETYSGFTERHKVNVNELFELGVHGLQLIFNESYTIGAQWFIEDADVNLFFQRGKGVNFKTNIAENFHLYEKMCWISMWMTWLLHNRSIYESKQSVIKSHTHTIYIETMCRHALTSWITFSWAKTHCNDQTSRSCCSTRFCIVSTFSVRSFSFVLNYSMKIAQSRFLPMYDNGFRFWTMNM